LLAGVLLAGPLGHAAGAQVRILPDPGTAEDPAGAPAPDGLGGSEGGATGAPMSILPGPKVPPPDTPPAALPSDTPANGLVEDGGVQIGSLEQPDPSSIGTLNENNGGFAWTMWQGSDLTLVRTLLQELPGPLQSSALQDLSRRLLLTSAAVPEASTPAPEGEAAPSLLAVRLGRLAAAGRLEDSAALLERVAPFSAGPALEERRADIYLLQGRLDQACGLAETALQRSGDAYWLRLSAFCDARTGAVDAAARTLDLLAETGSTDPLYDALFTRLISGKTGQAPDDMSMANVSPLIFSMLGVLKVPLTAEILLSSNPMVLSAVATAENAGPTVRLEALEQAAGIGAVPVSKLAEAYMAQSFTDAQKAGAMDQANTGGGAELNAMLYQLVGQASDAASRLDSLSAALRLARRQGQFPLMAKLYLDATRSIEPAPEFLPHAGDVVRALLLGGATDRATAWYELVRRAASSPGASQDLAATGALLDIWPLFHLAERDTGVPYSDQILDLWWQAQVTTAGDERMRRGRLLFGLLEALDYTVPEHFWIEVMAEPARVAERAPSVAHWRAMLRASAANRVGETVLASLDALGQQGLTMTSMSALSSVIGAFRQIGLPADADRIAVEAAILQGL
jgi:hypothetical protein